MGERVLDVGEYEPVWIDSPFLHGHGADQVRREARFRLQRLGGREAPVRMRFLQGLETVVHLHRRLHSLDVVPVVRKDRDQEDDAIDQVASDGHDVARVLARQTSCVPIELEVTRAAVDHPARGACGARAPVALFEEQDGKPAHGEVARDPCAGDASADDNDVLGA